MTALATMIRGARSTFKAGTTITERNIQRSLMMQYGGGIELVGGEFATYEGLYETQPWVKAAVDRTANSLARLPLKVYVNPDEPAERERIRAGALAELLKTPWLGGGQLHPGTQFDFLQAIVKNLSWHGNMVFVKHRSRPGEPPAELLPSNASYWSIKEQRSEGRTVAWYVFDPGMGQPKIPFLPEEVIHFKFWGTGKAMWAPSPMKALRTTLMLEDAAQRAAISAFENGMRQAGFFSAPATMEPAQFERYRAQLSERYGGPDNAMKTVLLDNGIKWESMGNNAEQSELVNLRKMTREEVAAVFAKSPPMIGILDRSTFNNIEELHLMDYDDLDVWATMIEQTLEAQLIAPEPLFEGQYAEIDLNKILRGDPVKRFGAYMAATGRPWMTVNETRARENLPPLDDPEADALAPVPNASVKGDAVGGEG